MNPNLSFNISEDSPITTAKDDVFGRKRIVDAVVQTIINKSQSKHTCFTIGIYGKWGDGKTSTLNLISEQLNQQENIIISCFNPWLFKDQESLLLDFFNSIDGKNISQDFVKGLKKYAPIVSLGLSGLVNIFAPGAGTMMEKGVTTFIDKLPDLKENVNSRKKQLSEEIVKSQKHLVIIIDDVDRLDKSEIHALFKLIKQTASFDNTIFIIAMDKEMVAKALCSFYENGDIQAGHNFIEKIIQAQLYLPKISQGQLLQYFTLKFKAILSNLPNTDLIDEREILEAQYNIHKYALPLFETARQIIQYINVLSFSLPLLYTEVNISDLCLLEALKIVSPEAYKTIRNNKARILGQMPDGVYMLVRFASDQERKEAAEKEKQDFIEMLTINTPHHYQYELHYLLGKILPSYFYSSTVPTLEYDSSKRLCSERYFEKYFIHDTPSNIISEDNIDVLTNEIKTSIDAKRLNSTFDYYIQKYSIDEFTRVLQLILYKRTLQKENIGKLCVALSLLKSNSSRTRFTETDHAKQWELFIVDTLNIHINNYDNEGSPIKDFDTILTTLQEITKYSPALFSLFVVVEFLRKGFAGYGNEDRLNEIVMVAIKRFIKEKSETALFDLGQICILELFPVWQKANQQEYQDFIRRHIPQDDFNIAKLINTLIYNGESKYYEPFCKLFDKKLVYEKLQKEIERVPTLRRKEKNIETFMSIYESEQQR